MTMVGTLLRLPGTYAAIIDENQTPLHVSFNNSVTRPYLKKSEWCFFFKIWSSNRIIEGNVQGGLILAAYVPGNLNFIVKF